MKEKSITFTPPMVKAILDGRKIQHREIVKFNAAGRVQKSGKQWHRDDEDAFLACPYGQPGDRLWVREKFKTICVDEQWDFIEYGDGTKIQPKVPDHNTGFRFSWDCDNDNKRWRPAIHMPRWASRINLKIIDISLGNLQSIIENDAIAEGLDCMTKDGILYKYGIADADGMPGKDDFGWPWVEWHASPVIAYKKLWEQINGPGAWDKNPWVWVIEFKKI